jgi:starch synthase
LVAAEAGSDAEEAAFVACREAARAGWEVFAVLPWRSAGARGSFGTPAAITESRAVELRYDDALFHGELRRGAAAPGTSAGLEVWWAVPQATNLDPALAAGFVAAAALDLAREKRCRTLCLSGLRAALAPILLATRFGAHPELEEVRTLWCVDELEEAGWIEPPMLRQLGLPASLGEPPFGLPRRGASVVRCGLLLADALLVPAARGVKEDLVEAAAEPLREILRQRLDAVSPFAWSLDRESWDPDRPGLLVARYSVAAPAGKVACKSALQKQAGLPVDEKTPLVLWRTRRADDLDTAIEALPALLRQRAEVIVVGPRSGAAQDAQRWSQAVGRSRNRALVTWRPFESSEWPRLLAAADIAVLPPAWDAYGFDVGRALRFGTLPVFHASAGAAAAAGSLGFPYRAALGASLRRALGRALAMVRRPEWAGLCAQAMALEDPAPKGLRKFQASLKTLAEKRVRRIELPAPRRAEIEAPDRPAPEPPDEPFIDWGPALPERYGEDVIEVLVQSPRSIYIYWEVSPETQRRAGFESFRLRLVDDRGRRDLASVGDFGEYWERVEPAGRYAAEIVAQDGRVVLRSRPVHSPPERPSDDLRLRWSAGARGSAFDAAPGEILPGLAAGSEAAAVAWPPAGAHDRAALSPASSAGPGAEQPAARSPFEPRAEDSPSESAPSSPGGSSELRPGRRFEPEP